MLGMRPENRVVVRRDVVVPRPATLQSRFATAWQVTPQMRDDVRREALHIPVEAETGRLVGQLVNEIARSTI